MQQVITRADFATHKWEAAATQRAALALAVGPGRWWTSERPAGGQDVGGKGLPELGKLLPGAKGESSYIEKFGNTVAITSCNAENKKCIS